MFHLLTRQPVAGALLCLALAAPSAAQPAFHLNARGYFERAGVDVMAFQDFYPDGHQGGVTVVMHGERLAANGDLRLEATPGQWSPVPHQRCRLVDSTAATITTWLAFPDSTKNRTGFNPIEYPDLYLPYAVRVEPDGDAIRVFVDLEKPLPAEWVGRVGFNLELYPAALFGRGWTMDGGAGIFPRQPGGPATADAGGVARPVPFATGRRLVVAPEADALRLEIESPDADLELLDGRLEHNNGWFVVRSLVPGGKTRGALAWTIRPHAIPGWQGTPTVQVSQVGYHPDQRKVAIVELDRHDAGGGAVRLRRVAPGGGLETVLEKEAERWEGTFLRYNYRRFDFSDVREPGLYVLDYRGAETHPFVISDSVYARHVWQPTLEYFLPVQMCHMRVEEKYRVWHGACHLDDARMAPADTNHFDGYAQGPDLLAPFHAGDHVPGLDRGGWHDAGDDDLRIESQADEVWTLAAMYELFGVDYDATRIDQQQRLVQIHQPDGQPDLLQQVEHGVLNILGGYQSLGRLYRGVIVPTLEQYRLLGDVTNSTDNYTYDAALAPDEQKDGRSGRADDRWVFTEENAGHEYKGIAALAIAGRVLRGYDDTLAARSTAAARALWAQPRPAGAFADRMAALTELLLTTRDPLYRQALLGARDEIAAQVGQVGWMVGRALPVVDDADFARTLRGAVAGYAATVEADSRKNPYGVPYEPYIWGAGWGIQRFGVEQYFLHRAFPDVVPPDYALDALNFILGVHPGANTASFASGVGARSMTTGYGLNRADWSYIPGGVVSGTALIRPDLPELKNFPYLWQQAEYVMGGGATHFMFLVLAARQMLAR